MSFETFIQPLSIGEDALPKLAVSLSKTYQSLARESTEQFLATPINVLPDGSETGRMLAIDVGGSNLRVGFVQLFGNSEISRSYDQSWRIGENVRRSTGEHLFSWIGDRIAEVVEACRRDLIQEGEGNYALGPVIPLGITWSFPLKQDTISSATLLKLGKGFKIPGEANLGRLLLEGYARHTQAPSSLPRIEIAAITNDTVATLASLAYTSRPTPSRRVVLGLIVGTGMNAALLMELSSLHDSKRNSIKLPAKVDANHTRIVLNTEWSLWGTIGPIKEAGLVTRWDDQLNRECDDPGFMPYEYMTGGRYIGELVRLIASDYFMVQKKVDNEALPKQLHQRYGLHTDYLSDVLATDISNSELVSKLKHDLTTEGYTGWNWTSETAEVMRSATRAIRKRSANLVAAAVVGGLICAGDFITQDDDSKNAEQKIQNLLEQELIVAYTGGVISQFPHYLRECQYAIDKIAEKLSHPKIEQRVVLREVLNGGVIGAGVLAGTVWNLPQQQRGTT